MAQVNCPNCGAYLTVDPEDIKPVMFCMHCGTRITDFDDLVKSKLEHERKIELETLQHVQEMERIIILNDHEKDPEEADMDVLFLLLNLRDIRTRYHLGFNITVEMQKERNHKLAGKSDQTDFLVSSSMSSLILAQLAESPELISVFREILSNKGNELYLKNAYDIHMIGTWSIRDIRRVIMQNKYIFLGYLDSNFKSHFNPNLDDEIRLEKDYWIIVLGKD